MQPAWHASVPPCFMQTFAPLTALPSVVLPVVCSLTQAFVSCGHSKPPTTGVHCPDSPHALHLQVFVPPHPLVSHWVAVARNAASPPPMFRAALAELGRLLIYEATRDWLPTLEGSVATPCGTAEVTFIDPGQPVKVGSCEWPGLPEALQLPLAVLIAPGGAVDFGNREMNSWLLLPGLSCADPHNHYARWCPSYGPA